jgi:hypothetical protein
MAVSARVTVAPAPFAIAVAEPGFVSASSTTLLGFFTSRRLLQAASNIVADNTMATRRDLAVPSRASKQSGIESLV